MSSKSLEKISQVISKDSHGNPIAHLLGDKESLLLRFTLTHIFDKIGGKLRIYVTTISRNC